MTKISKQASSVLPTSQGTETLQSLKLNKILDDLTLNNIGLKSPKFFTKTSLRIWLEKNHSISRAVFETKTNAEKIDEFLKTNFYTLAASAKISTQLENYKNENWPEPLPDPIDVDWDITYPNQFKKGFGVNNHGNSRFEQIENPNDNIISLYEDDEVLDY